MLSENSKPQECVVIINLLTMISSSYHYLLTDENNNLITSTLINLLQHPFSEVRNEAQICFTPILSFYTSSEKQALYQQFKSKLQKRGVTGKELEQAVGMMKRDEE